MNSSLSAHSLASCLEQPFSLPCVNPSPSHKHNLTHIIVRSVHTSLGLQKEVSHLCVASEAGLVKSCFPRLRVMTGTQATVKWFTSVYRYTWHVYIHHMYMYYTVGLQYLCLQVNISMVLQ